MIEILPGLSRLSKVAIFEENGQGREVSVVRGYKVSGDREVQGVFTLTREANGNLLERYILTQDTLGSPPVRGVILEGGETVEFVGFRQRPSEAEVRKLFDTFDSCERYCNIVD